MAEFVMDKSLEERKQAHRSAPANRYYHLALKKYRRKYNENDNAEETITPPQSEPYFRPFAYTDTSLEGRYSPLAPEDALKRFEKMQAGEFEKWMKYYGSLRKIDLTITASYTAEGAWAHTDCCSIINALPMRPSHTLEHEKEHVLADILGLSQNEYWIDFRARDPSRAALRSTYVVVRGDIY